MEKRQLTGTQINLLPAIFPHIPHRMRIILRVAHNRTADIRKLHPYLVVAAGENVDKQLRRFHWGRGISGNPPSPMKEVIHSGVEFQSGESGSGSGGVTDPGGVCPAVLTKIIFENPMFTSRLFFHKYPIVFAERGFFGILQLTVQFPGGSRSLGENQYAGDGLVQAVDDGQIRFVSGSGRVSSAGMIKVGFDQPYHIGSGKGTRLGCDSVGLDTDDDLIVFI